MPVRPLSVILIVVGTIALIAVAYMITLCVMAIRETQPPEALLGAMKDVGLVAIGALTGLLARTSTGTEPSPVKVENTKAEPIPTAPQD